MKLREDKKTEENRKNQIKPRYTSELNRIEDKSFIRKEPENLYVQTSILPDSIDTLTGDAVLYGMNALYTRDIVGFPGMKFMEIPDAKRYLCIDYTIYNYGNDTACDVLFHINNRQVLNQFSVVSKGYKKIKLIITMSIDVEEERTLNLKSEFINIDNSVKYIAEEKFIVYKDANQFIT